MKLLKSLDKCIYNTVLFLGVADMVALFLILLVNIIIRICGLSISLSWYSEVVEILFAWLVMLGAVALCRSADHFRVDLLYQKLGDKRSYYWLEACCHLVALAFYGYFLYYSYSLAVNATQTMPVLHIPKGVGYMCMPICSVFMCIYAVRDVCNAICRAIGKVELPEIKKI